VIEMGFTATQVVHTEEGAIVGPGEQVGENFDPEAGINPSLIEEGQLRASDGSQASPDPSPGGADPEAQAEAEIASQGVEATKGATELAVAEGVDLAEVTGTGDGGKITVDDVRAHLAE
jgi:pyruvate/2-oxoglutarate dehydrogenase complex dihydrolipoamide acyltransferase (E2) component